MGHRSARWRWSKVSTIHDARARDAITYDGAIYVYRFRSSATPASLPERWVGLAWCSTCREYAGAMVYVPQSEQPLDLLTDLPPAERERLLGSEIKLLDHLDRIVRRGRWPSEVSDSRRSTMDVPVTAHDDGSPPDVRS